MPWPACARLATWGLAVVRGRSMQPTLHDGDRLLVRHGAAPRAGRPGRRTPAGRGGRGQAGHARREPAAGGSSATTPPRASTRGRSARSPTPTCWPWCCAGSGRCAGAPLTSGDRAAARPAVAPGHTRLATALTRDRAAPTRAMPASMPQLRCPTPPRPRAGDPVFDLHVGGKMEIASTVAARRPRRPLAGLHARASPGCARRSPRSPALVDDYTWVSNTVAVVTDGTAVLGLGDIGPAAAMPVMEGKAVLFKQFGGVDAVPICLDTTDADEIVETVVRLAPSFGGINLEDISAPRCFEIEQRLKERLDIPVFHDDQHGTAVVVLAALESALRLTGRDSPTTSAW